MGFHCSHPQHAYTLGWCCSSFEDDIILIDFRTEVDELKGNGRWTNRATDLLPLALSNLSRYLPVLLRDQL
jgi:hypothetical protein